MPQNDPWKRVKQIQQTKPMKFAVLTLDTEEQDINLIRTHDGINIHEGGQRVLLKTKNLQKLVDGLRKIASM